VVLVKPKIKAALCITSRAPRKEQKVASHLAYAEQEIGSENAKAAVSRNVLETAAKLPLPELEHASYFCFTASFSKRLEIPNTDQAVTTGDQVLVTTGYGQAAHDCFVSGQANRLLCRSPGP
jgi:hypothetical protein